MYSVLLFFVFLNPVFVICMCVNKEAKLLLEKGSFRRKKPVKKWDSFFVEALFPNAYRFGYMFSHFGRYLFVQYNITKELAKFLEEPQW